MKSPRAELLKQVRIALAYAQDVGRMGGSRGDDGAHREHSRAYARVRTTGDALAEADLFHPPFRLRHEDGSLSPTYGPVDFAEATHRWRTEYRESGALWDREMEPRRRERPRFDGGALEYLRRFGPRLDPDEVAVATMVLLDGKTPSQAASRLGMHYQRAHALWSRFISTWQAAATRKRAA